MRKAMNLSKSIEPDYVVEGSKTVHRKAQSTRMVIVHDVVTTSFMGGEYQITLQVGYPYHKT